MAVELNREERPGSGTGTWAPVEFHGFQFIDVGCPNCGKHTRMSRRIRIDEDGNVQPAFMCASRCGFHDFVRLLEYGKESGTDTNELLYGDNRIPDIGAGAGEEE